MASNFRGSFAFIWFIACSLEMPPKTAKKLKERDENSPKISSFFSKNAKPAALKRYDATRGSASLV